MENLPTELKIMILDATEDFSDLYNLIRTCRSNYNAFKEKKSSILATKLRQMLPPEVLGDALAAETSWSRDRYTSYDAKEHIIDSWPVSFACIQYSYPSPGTEIFDNMVRLHASVEWLTNDLCKSFTKTQSSLNFEVLPLCLEEKVRIQRAFYRLHLLCNIFAVSPQGTQAWNKTRAWEHTRDRFLSSHPLWKLEELACIEQYLKRELQSRIDLRWDRYPYSGWTMRGMFVPHYCRDAWIGNGMMFLQKVLSAVKIEPEKINDEIADRFKTNRVLFESALWFNIWQRRCEHLSEAEAAMATPNEFTRPNAGWLIKYFQLAGKDVLGDNTSWAPNRWSWGYCLWSNARLSSIPQFYNLKINATDIDWKVSTEVIINGRVIPQGWPDIIDSIDYYRYLD